MTKEGNRKGSGDSINIPSDVSGENILLGSNWVNQKHVEGAHVGGITTELQAGEGDYVNKKGEKLVINEKKVKLANNVNCEFTITAKEVGVTECENCEITIHEPKVIAITKCTNCEVTIYTKVDPEKLTIVDAKNDDDTEITFIDPTDDQEWNWPPEDEDDDDWDDEEDDGDDEDDEDDEEDDGGGGTNGGVHVGGTISGSNIAKGDGMNLSKENLGPELPIGTEVFLPNTYGGEIKNSNYNNTNLTGIWERQYGKTNLKPKPGFRVYVRVE